MNSRWLHERLKREAIGFPRWRHKYISFQTWFNAAFDWNFTTSNLRRFARIWWIHLILFLVDLFTKFSLFFKIDRKKLGLGALLAYLIL